jgi:hypothetical protein
MTKKNSLNIHEKHYFHIPISSLWIIGAGVVIATIFLIWNLTFDTMNIRFSLDGFQQKACLIYLLISVSIAVGSYLRGRLDKFIGGLIAGLIAGLIVGLIVGLIGGLIAGLIAGLIGGLIMGLTRGLLEDD